MLNIENPRVNFFENVFDQEIPVSFNTFLKGLHFEFQGIIDKKRDFPDGFGPTNTSGTKSPNNTQYNFNIKTFPNNETNTNSTNMDPSITNQTILDKTSISNNTQPKEFDLATYLANCNLTIDKLIKFQIVISNTNEELSLLEDESNFLNKVYTLDFTEKSDFTLFAKNGFLLKQNISKESVFNLNEKNEVFQGDKSIEAQNFNINGLTLSNFVFNATKDTKMEFRILLDLDLIDKNNLNFTLFKLDRKFITNDAQINQGDINFFSYSSQIKNQKSFIYPMTIYQHKYTYALYEVKDDVGLIFSDWDNIYEFNKRTITTLTIDIGEKRKTIPFLEINFYGVKKIYMRVYKKLQNVFADLGGIFSSLILFGKILVTALNIKLFDYDAVNFLFGGNDGDDSAASKSYRNNYLIGKILSEKKSDVDIIKNNLAKNSIQKDKKNNDVGDPKADIDNSNNEFIYSNRNSIADKNLMKENSELKFNKTNYKNKEEEFNLKIYQYEVDNKSKEYKESFKNINQTKLEDNNTSLSINENKCNQDMNFKTIELSLNPNNLNITENNVILNKKQVNGNSSIDDSHNFVNNNNNNNNKYLVHFANNPKPIEEEKIINNDSILKEKINLIIEKKSNLDHQKKEYVNFNSCEFFKTFLCCAKLKSNKLFQKEEIFLSARKKIYGYLNVLNYFNLYEDLEKMKSIIFDENQKVLFNFLRKRNYDQINNSDSVDRVIKSIKFYSSNKNNFNDVLGNKMIDHSIKEIRDLIYL